MNTREIERKFTVEGLTYEEASAMLSHRYGSLINAISYDLYWESPGVDFIRLRENSRELTVKVTDRGTIVDRIEENVVVEHGSMESAARQQTLLHGEPMKLVKRFSVFQTFVNPDPNMDTSVAIICLYTVSGDKKNRLFLEVEADNLFTVDYMVTVLMRKLTLTPVMHSLFRIFKEGL